MVREGWVALPFVLVKKVIVVERKTQAVSARALSLFAGKAQRALGIRGEVNIRVTSNSELQKLNRRFRSKNKPTDVLSFPSAMPELAGDIAISADIAAANAADLGHSTEMELKVLILHGLLHLAGYDHDKDNGDMQARETELRQHLKLPAGLIERASPRSDRRASAVSQPASRKPQGCRP